MSARDSILQRLRRCASVSDRQSPPVKTQALPAQALADESATRLAIFITQATASGARVLKTENSAELQRVLKDITGNSDGASCDTTVWPSVGSIATGNDKQTVFSVVHADAAIAETGTVCLHSHQVTSRSLFLCEHLVVIVAESGVLRYQEDYWTRQASHDLPTAIHLITGPSRTADVEQTIQIGAHGPESITIFLLPDTR